MGFKDGTANLKAEDPDALEQHVWVAEGDARGAPWLVDGSFLVARRINMHIETWDRTSLQEQEAIMGRDKGEGAPLSGGDEFTPLDFGAQGANGPLISLDAHVRLAHPSANDGAQLLRRGYNFTDGTDGLGRLDAGLFFIAFVRDPVSQFVPLQNRLARDDSLSEYLKHTGSALFAVPPGVAGPSSFVGEALFV
jgi:deferrochelatase/peroxidase EfeB